MTNVSLKQGESQSVTFAEIQDVMADEGYSADKRKGWLKEVLTSLTSSGENASEERDQLIREIQRIIQQNQDDAPKSDDVL